VLLAAATLCEERVVFNRFGTPIIFASALVAHATPPSPPAAARTAQPGTRATYGARTTVVQTCASGSRTTVSCGTASTQMPNANGQTAVFTVTNGDEGTATGDAIRHAYPTSTRPKLEAHLQLTPCGNGSHTQITPCGSTYQMGLNANGRIIYTVTNNGSVGDTYQLTADGTGVIVSVSQSADSVIVPAHSSGTVTVNYTTGPNYGIGTVILYAFGSLDAASGSNTISVRLPYQVTVTPDSGTTVGRPANTGSYSETFTIKNTGLTRDTFAIRCTGSTNVTCTGTSIGSIALDSSASTTALAYYTVGAPGSGRLGLTASSSHGSDGGWFVVPVGSVNVTPDAASVTALPSSTVAQRFLVQNGTTAALTYTLTAVCSPPLTSCSAPSQIQVPAGGTGTATVSYQTPSSGTGKVTLTAANGTTKDSGWVNVTAGGSVQTPVVDLASVSTGSTVERSLCLTIAAGNSGAAECGDLRVIHPLPTTRVRGKARTPTLLYNSQSAHPYPLVAANVTLPSGAATPDSIVAILKDSATLAGLARASWAGSDWTAGSVRRLVLGYDALSQVTGIYPYVLEVDAWYGATPRNSSPANGQLVVVNRSTSHFGAGWWLAGLEHLNVTTKVWVGGDGSVHRYTSAGSNVWKGPALERPDTLRWDGTNYVRYLPHGLRVKYDTAGKHIATVNRVGDSTAFTYNGDTLKTITLPLGGARLAYQFAYASGYLATVTPAASGSTPRTITFTVTSSQLTAIRGPDTTQVRFTYDPSFINRIVARYDRRGYATRYAYDAGSKLARDSLFMGTGQQPIVSTLRAFESQGIGAAVDTAFAGTVFDGPRTDAGDTTRFWLDRYGSPRRVRNALGYETVLTRTDTLWPALVTKVRYPNGRVVSDTFDARGNVLLLTDSSTPPQNGHYATTRYEWDPLWDFVTKIVPPEKDSTVMAYDPVNGNRLWQQDARGAVGRDSFTYYQAGVASRGLMRAIWTPSESLSSLPHDSIVYDTLGNVFKTKTPLGLWTTSYKDSLGRDTLILSPPVAELDSAPRLRTVYDVGDRDTLWQAIGPGVAYYDQLFHHVHTVVGILTARKYFNPEGMIDSLKRSASPDSNGLGVIQTQWRYDSAGRVVREIAPDGAADSTVYDAAGNPVATLSRRHLLITTTYDALSRRTQQVRPPVSYAELTFPVVNDRWYFPRFRLDGTGGLETANDGTYGYMIPGDTDTFVYDSADNIVRADNATALVRRHYSPNGKLTTDTLKIRSYVGNDTTKHVYGFSYTYDLDGRRDTLRHPASLAPRVGGNVRDTETYGYDPGTGQLATIVDVLGKQYTFRYDVERRIRALDDTYGTDSLIYDLDSRTIRRLRPAVHDDTMAYGARGKIVHAGTMGEHVDTLIYDGLGALVYSQASHSYSQNSKPAESYTADPFGFTRAALRTTNIDSGQASTKAASYYHAMTGRLDSIRTPPGEAQPILDWARPIYDSSGEVLRQTHEAQALTVGGYPGELVEEVLHYYDAGERERLLDKRTCIVGNGQGGCDPLGVADYTERAAFEEIRYDALGRRVLVRTRSDWACNTRCFQAAVRTVWDGDQVLYEISAPGYTGAGAALMEQDTGIVVKQDTAHNAPYFPHGRVLYTHGQQLDRPLSLIRMEYSDSFYAPVLILPNANWHGVYDNSVNPLPCVQEGANSVCMQIDWPAPYLWRTQLERPRGLLGPTSWMGSLIEGGRDASGQHYLRNRSYDPLTGLFTQEDPIGLAGGLNLYGFAGGDPVNFGDPFGLRPLTSQERDALGDYCYKVNCDLVDVQEGHGTKSENAWRKFWLKASGGVSITVGNTIYAADRDISEGYITTPALVHEATHVLQYQSRFRSDLLTYAFELGGEQASNKAYEITRGLVGRNAYDVRNLLAWDREHHGNWPGFIGGEQEAQMAVLCMVNKDLCYMSPYVPR